MGPVSAMEYQRLTAHAYVGILTRPHIGLVAEDGPEGIIPLSPGKRARGLELWEQTGRMLGVSAYSNGGVPVAVPSVSSQESGYTPTVQVSVSAPQIVLESGNGTPEDLERIREGVRSMFGEITEDMAEKISLVFSNMPHPGRS